MEDVFELDPECQYWQADIDAGELLEKYKLGCGGFSDWLDRVSDTDWYTTEPNGIAVYAMRGKFEALIWPDRCHQFTFTPGAGETLALIVPVIEDGKTIDLIAMAAHDEWVWGCVTGRGKITGNETEGEPLRVHKSAFQFLLWDCDGVLPLEKSALPQLATAPQLLAEDIDHCADLSWQVFVKPAIYGEYATESDSHLATHNAELLARDIICIDDERYDVGQMISEQTRFEADNELRKKGFYSESRFRP